MAMTTQFPLLLTDCTEVECQPTLDILICVNRRRFIQGGAILGTDSGSSQISTGQSASAAQPLMQIRVARPTDKLKEVVSFYRDALGMPVIAQFENHAGYSGVILGVPTERFQLEFTHAETGSPCPAPSKDHLLVFYMPDSQTYAKAVKRLHDQGHAPVEPENPYWEDKSLTFEDPDGWRVVIYRGEAFAKP
jgi:catechol 2,3-dioxygenase-like lactoylglutathione lyase family enzyme